MSVPQRVAQLTGSNKFLREHLEVQLVDLLITDVNGAVRGKWIERNSLNKIFKKGINSPVSLFALDIIGPTVESIDLGLDIGDADRICYPIPGALSMKPWQKRPAAQSLMTMHELEDRLFLANPREVLCQVVAGFAETELTIIAAFELEFYLIDQENVNDRLQPPHSSISGKHPQSVQVCSTDDLDGCIKYLQDIIDGARAQGIPADTIVTESTPAQFKVNLNHINDALKTCDYAVLLKRLIKNIAYNHEMDATFMAKPYPGQAGNGLHVHISLLDKHGNDIFTSEDPEQNTALRHAIGGVLETLPASVTFLCPNVDSYHRFGSQFYAPGTPSWSLDNRIMALRVPTGSSDTVRLEHRAASADANPYLLLAAVLAGVHHGLTNKVEPGAPIEGNSYEQTEPSLPNNPRDALCELDESEIMAKYIDPKYIDIFVACEESEPEEFEHSISGLEYNWYLHTV